MKIVRLITPLYQVAGASTIYEKDLSQSITGDGQSFNDIHGFEHPGGEELIYFNFLA